MCDISPHLKITDSLDFDFIIWGGQNSKNDTHDDLFMSSPTKYDLSDRHDEKPRCVKIIEIDQRDAKIETNARTINLNSSRQLVVQVKLSFAVIRLNTKLST